jgi:hypothetical protein
MVEIINARAALAEHFRIRNDLEERYVDVKVMLKFDLNKYDVRGGLESTGSSYDSVRCCCDHVIDLWFS